MHGYNLVAVVFVREISDPLTSLVKQLDRQLENAPPPRDGLKWGVFFVFCNEGDGLDRDLAALAEREQLKHVVLCHHKTGDGPRRYRLNADAHLTAVVYDDDRGVVGNVALRRGELDDEHRTAVVEQVLTVLPRYDRVANR